MTDELERLAREALAWPTPQNISAYKYAASPDVILAFLEERRMLREALTYARSMLAKADRSMDHATVEWAEVATAAHYIGHIVDGRARDLGEASVIEHERYVALQAEPARAEEEAS